MNFTSEPKDSESLTDGHGTRLQRYTEAVFQSLGLSIIYNAIAKVVGWELKEEKKVVFVISWKQKQLRFIFYVLPVGACIVLLFFNFFNYYIGGELAGPEGEDTQKFNALQFAAKLHELLMVASLVSILVTIVRVELSSGLGLPFGAVFTPLQIQSIDILWSPELWGTIGCAIKARKPRWILLASCVIVFSILGLSVGPSSAVLMRPRLQTWNAGGTPFWIRGTEPTLFPTVIDDDPGLPSCLVANANTSCPSSGWEIINQNVISFWPRMLSPGMAPEVVQLNSVNSVRDLTTVTRSAGNDIFTNAWTVATIPLTFIADSVVDLAKYWYIAAHNEPSFNLKYRVDVTSSVNALQPIVLARCNAVSETEVAFPILSSLSVVGGGNPDDSNSRLNQNLIDTPTGLARNVSTFVQSTLASNLTKPNLYWMDDSYLLGELNATLAVAAVVPANGSLSDLLYCCSIDSRFWNQTTFTYRSAVGFAQSKASVEVGTIGRNFQKVYPSATWARYLNPSIPNTNSSVFAAMVSTAGLWSSTNLQPEWLSNLEPAMEQIFTTLIANGISRLNYNYSWAGSFTGDYLRQLLSKSGRIDVGGNAFDISADEQAQATKFQMNVAVTGYAYSSQGSTQKAAIVILMLYSLIVIAYMFCLLCRPTIISPMWGKPSEIAALAMNSDKPRELQNTGAGISTVSVFENKVSITAREGDLQMVFGDPPRGEHLENDKKYG